MIMNARDNNNTVVDINRELIFTRKVRQTMRAQVVATWIKLLHALKYYGRRFFNSLYRNNGTIILFDSNFLSPAFLGQIRGIEVPPVFLITFILKKNLSRMRIDMCFIVTEWMYYTRLRYR